MIYKWYGLGRLYKWSGQVLLVSSNNGENQLFPHPAALRLQLHSPCQRTSIPSPHISSQSLLSIITLESEAQPLLNIQILIQIYRGPRRFCTSGGQVAGDKEARWPGGRWRKNRQVGYPRKELSKCSSAALTLPSQDTPVKSYDRFSASSSLRSQNLKNLKASSDFQEICPPKNCCLLRTNKFTDSPIGQSDHSNNTI